MKYKFEIIERQEIINPSSKRLYDDNGLYYLDGIQKEIIEVEADSRTQAKDFVEKNYVKKLQFSYLEIVDLE